METFQEAVKITDQIILGEDKKLLIAGPCAIESLDLCLEVGEKVKEIASKLGLNYIFKSSFDKANRTSGGSYRGPGLEKGLAVLESVKTKLDLPILTDVHETWQVQQVAEVVDVLQIPAFLCRQTDLIQECARTGKVVNIKKGQFMAAEDMQYAVDKVREAGSNKVFLTERGTSFGYHNLVVDFRSIPIMRQYAPVIFDCTHSIQQPGGLGGASGGQREFAPYLAKAASAVGIDGFFIETHPEPEKALSDGANMIKLDELESLISSINLFAD